MFLSDQFCKMKDRKVMADSEDTVKSLHEVAEAGSVFGTQLPYSQSE